MMKIHKQIPSIYSVDNYRLSPLKTQNNNRDLPINYILLEDLEKLYNSQKQYKNFSQEWYVFGNELPIHKDTIRRRKNANCKLANVKQIRLYDFRHSCANLLISKDADIKIVAEFLGHTKIDETVNTYIHMFKSKLNNIVNIIDN